jgi:hypothetical protein
MKFLDTHELNLFFIESGNASKINTEDPSVYETPVEMLEAVFIKRQDRKGGLLDFRKSKDTEGQWRGMRYKMLKGIRRFHKSTEGKRQHRAMARFLTNKEFRPDVKSQTTLSLQERSNLITDLDNFVLGLEEFHSKYFHPIDDYFDMFAVRGIVHDMCENVISSLISPSELTDDQCDFIDSLVEPTNVISYLSESTNRTCDEVTVIWNQEKDNLVVDLPEFSPNFYLELSHKVRDIIK